MYSFCSYSIQVASGDERDKDLLKFCFTAESPDLTFGKIDDLRTFDRGADSDRLGVRGFSIDPAVLPLSAVSGDRDWIVRSTRSRMRPGDKLRVLLGRAFEDFPSRFEAN